MRRIILLIVVLLAILYVVVSFTQIESIIDTLRKGNLPFLLAAFVFEAICLFNNTATYRNLHCSSVEIGITQIVKWNSTRSME